MSRPPAPPPLTYPQQPTATATTLPPVTMADTQTLPSLPPPFLDHYSSASRQPTTRIQLPPLTIPQSAGRPEYPPATTTQHLPAAQPPLPTTAPRPTQPRTYPGPAAPLDKLLSPHPSYTPPRLEAPYSPNSPPRSAIEYGGPSYHRRAMSDKYGYEEPRHQIPEPPYMSPVDHRQPYSTLPSPASSYPSQFPGSHPQYRHQIAPPAPPHVPAPSSYPSQAYNDSGPVPPPPRIAPSIPPPQIHSQEKKYTTSDHAPRSYVPQRDSELRYELKVRQQPIAARACGFGERDRRVIDPPPIIQLSVTDTQSRPVDLDELRYSLNVVHCTLWNADGTHEETALVQPDRRATRRLMGQLVASPSVAKDEHDNEGCFFCFPDLSCRTHGRYRLRFVLMRIDPANLQVGGSSPILTEVVSDMFTVYTAKDFPGMRPSSALTRALKLQGCNIQVKKGNEKALARKRPAEHSDGDDGDDKKKRK